MSKNNIASRETLESLKVRAQIKIICVLRTECKCIKVSWPSGLRRQFKALVLRGAGSNPAEAYFYNARNTAF